MHNRTASIHLHGHMPEPQGSSTNDPCMIHGKEGDGGTGEAETEETQRQGFCCVETKALPAFMQGGFCVVVIVI